MTREEVLREIKKRLEAVYGDRLRGVVLYGSEATGKAGPDSDIDVLVLLEEPVAYGRELRRSIHALYPLTLEWGRPVSPTPVGIDTYEAAEFPLYKNARREGVVA